MRSHSNSVFKEACSGQSAATAACVCDHVCVIVCVRFQCCKPAGQLVNTSLLLQIFHKKSLDKNAFNVKQRQEVSSYVRSNLKAGVAYEKLFSPV